ncbi:MAG: G-strand telomere binding protein 1 [Monoraphidium minutum]|nr:MAG: G-strand telomere binding protein 1 [Monoraphidium minutum]
MAEEGVMPEEGVMRIGRRCYVSNLAWRTSWQDLKDKFRECGNVVYANVTRGDDGRSKGWGIVEFETPDEAIAAVNTLNGVDLGGRNISVREDREDRDVKQAAGEDGVPIERPPRPPRGERGRGAGGAGGERGRGRGRGRGPPPVIEGEPSGFQIVVQGLPWKFTWQDLKDHFVDIGDVERADIMQAPDGRSKGWGTVRFLTKEAAQAAIDRFHGSDLEGRTLTVFLDKKA